MRGQGLRIHSKSQLSMISMIPSPRKKKTVMSLGGWMTFSVSPFSRDVKNKAAKPCLGSQPMFYPGFAV